MSRLHSMKLWIGLCLVLLTCGAIGYFLIYRGPADLANRTEEVANRGVDHALDKAERVGSWVGSVGAKVRNALQITPTISYGGNVIEEGKASINELATAEHRFKQKYAWEHTFLGSTKKVEVQANFIAKAGYRLDRLPELHFNESGDTVVARLPDPVLLSNEQKNFRILKDENGVWNRLSKKDREHAQNELKRLADETARESTLFNDADKALIEQLTESVNESAPSPVKVIREPLAKPLPESTLN